MCNTCCITAQRSPGEAESHEGQGQAWRNSRASAQWRHAADQELVVGKNRLTSKACRASTGCCTVNADAPVLKMPAFSLAISCNVCTHLRYCNGTWYFALCTGHHALDVHAQIFPVHGVCNMTGDKTVSSTGKQNWNWSRGLDTFLKIRAQTMWNAICNNGIPTSYL